jgi:hypothetical protein
MQPIELKAIIGSTDEFAVAPIPVPEDGAKGLPHYVLHVNRSRSVRACPTSLTRARVVKMGVRYPTKFTLGCGDQEYTREKKNGVLIEFACPDKIKVRKAGSTVMRSGAAYYKERPLTTVVRGEDGHRRVQMVTLAQCVLAPWGEYAMIEAEREKEREEAEARKERINAVCEALGVPKGRRGEGWYGRTRFDQEPVWDAATDDYKRDAYGDMIRAWMGRVEMPIEQAEKIAKALAEAGVTLPV